MQYRKMLAIFLVTFLVLVSSFGDEVNDDNPAVDTDANDQTADLEVELPNENDNEQDKPEDAELQLAESSSDQKENAEEDSKAGAEDEDEAAEKTEEDTSEELKEPNTDSDETEVAKEDSNEPEEPVPDSEDAEDASPVELKDNTEVEDTSEGENDEGAEPEVEDTEEQQADSEADSQSESDEAAEETTERVRRDVDEIDELEIALQEDVSNADIDDEMKQENDVAEEKENDPKKPYAPPPYYPLPATSKGVWVPYGEWSPCTKNCHGGIQYRKRLCHYPPTHNPNVKKIPCKGLPKIVRHCNSKVPCKMYGYWSSWGGWGKCSKNCHQGRQIRRRLCKFKSYSGLYVNVPCKGHASTSRVCNKDKPCKHYGYWGAWGRWSACSKNCHQGYRTRNRFCLFKPYSGPIVKIPCKGHGNHKELCNVNKPCNLYGYWSSWGSWGSCNKNCHKGRQQRTRQCLYKPYSGPVRKVRCPGKNLPQSRDCNIGKPCLHYGYWSNWGAWSGCTKNCHQGKQHRRRTCLYKPVSGPVKKVPCSGGNHIDYRVCNKDRPCNHYGYWGAWGSWSKCSKNCHQGRQYRKRLCLYKPYSGPIRKVPCNGHAVHYRFCNKDKPCDYYGYWGAWGAWSKCSKNCYGGRQHRNRVCLYKPHSGPIRKISCKGISVHSQYCNEKIPCKNYGYWGSWGKWSVCSKNCHQGYRKRNRQCSYKSQVGPTVKVPCKGYSYQKQPCNVNKPCSIYGYWSHWGAWGKCSKNCDYGKQQRSRVCLYKSYVGPVRKIPCPQANNHHESRYCNKGKPCDSYGYWGAWGAWSVCSKNCHKGRQYRKRQCLYKPSNGPVRKIACKGSAANYKFCNVNKPCYQHGYWGAWGAWSKCSKNCHQGKRYRNRPCLYKASSGPVIKVPCKGGSHIHREPCNVDKPCIHYGYWGAWGAWSKCSKNCHQGRHFRKRVCLYKPHTGPIRKVPCKGGNLHYKPCNIDKPCLHYGYWSVWGAWSKCSKNCHQGKQKRTRLCLYRPYSGPIKKVPCKGDHVHFKPCNVGKPCLHYGYWSQWGAWGGCSKNCHQGRKSRSRTCLYKPTVGPIKKVPCSGGSHIHYQPCNVNKPCLHYGYWSQWGAWSKCDKNCHSGRQYRKRLCLYKPHKGPIQKVPCNGGSHINYKPCNVNKPCPHYGYWSAWGSWSKCSKNCHQGNQYRKRTCLYRPYSGPIRKVPCKGGIHSDTKSCNVNKPCNHYGYWGAWGAWSNCSKNCHQGKHYRERKCLFKPHNGPITRIPCKGHSRHEEPCNVNKPCKNYGYWGAWGAWSKCSKNCHQGKHYRERKCLFKPLKGPVIRVPCKGGSNRHEEPCNVNKPCLHYGYWSQWGAWSKCDKNCHSGRQYRKRLCLYKPYNGPIKKVPCSGGSHTNYKPCNVNKPCPHYGYWSAWGSWSKCSKNCHQGNQYRKRTCLYRPYSGPIRKVPCKGGIHSDTKPCNVDKPCNHYGYWGAWGAWSNCSKNCHQGKHYRERKCLFKPHNGPVTRIPCKGHNRHEEPCNVNKPCKHYGYWGAWGAWSKCSKNCHQGKHYRKRLCLYKPHSGPIIKVACTGGSNIHEEPCNVNKPCNLYGYWGAWGAWSKCSKNCHQGKHYRERKCLFKPHNGPIKKIPCSGGSHRHEEPCNVNKPCLHYGYWGAWGAWSKCSKNCHKGKQHRNRVCLYKPASGPITKVPCKGGHPTHSQDCNVGKPCPHYGYWSSWGAWSKCSKNCHKGYRERRRTCLYKPSKGPVRRVKCKGGDLHKGVCNLYKTCYLQGYWASWGSWGGCSTKCGRGTRRRQRSCTFPQPYPRPFYKGVPCKGSSYIVGACNLQNPCAGSHSGCYDKLGSYKCMVKQTKGYCKDYSVKNYYCRRTCGACVPTPYKPYDSPS